ncbi:MAG: universal stress protein [Desulfobacterium sp.]|jgi:nucleotide-binding universal stress UspA family protein|nr:universal stress protein [Desulfobacterium sp.]
MKRFKNILYVNDSTDDQAWGIARAVLLAESNQANLTVAAIVPTQALAQGTKSPPGRPTQADLKTDAATDLYEGLESLLQSYRPHQDIRLSVLAGTTYLETIRAVVRDAYDLVIKPAENPSWLDRIFGNNDMQLLRQCPCPVLIMKPHEKSSYNTILAAVDFNPLNPLGSDLDLNLEILELASLLALSNFASLHFAHAWEAVAEKTLASREITSVKRINDYVEKTLMRHKRGLNMLGDELKRWIGVDNYNYLSPRLHLPKGASKKMIPQLAEQLQVDLVVMGTFARTGISGFILGNTVEALLDQLSCSVLAVKPPGFKSSVRLE